MLIQPTPAGSPRRHQFDAGLRTSLWVSPGRSDDPWLRHGYPPAAAPPWWLRRPTHPQLRRPTPHPGACAAATPAVAAMPAGRRCARRWRPLWRTTGGMVIRRHSRFGEWAACASAVAAPWWPRTAPLAPGFTARCPRIRPQPWSSGPMPGLWSPGVCRCGNPSSRCNGRWCWRPVGWWIRSRSKTPWRWAPTPPCGAAWSN